MQYAYKTSYNLHKKHAGKFECVDEFCFSGVTQELGGAAGQGQNVTSRDQTFAEVCSSVNVK
jgi:hypothetical protein